MAFNPLPPVVSRETIPNFRVYDKNDKLIDEIEIDYSKYEFENVSIYLIHLKGAQKSLFDEERSVGGCCAIENLHLHDAGRPEGYWRKSWVAPNNGFGENQARDFLIPADTLIWKCVYQKKDNVVEHVEERYQSQKKIKFKKHTLPLFSYLTMAPVHAKIGFIGPVGGYIGRDRNAVHGGGIQIYIPDAVTMKFHRMGANNLEHNIKPKSIATVHGL